VAKKPWLRQNIPVREYLQHIANLRGLLSLYPLLLFLLAGCSLVGGVSSPIPGQVLFQDDFSEPSGDWPVQADSGGFTGYQDGAYRIQVEQPFTERQAIADFKTADALIQVMTTRNGGPTDNRFGILCRYQDALNYYSFQISTDGYFAVLKVAEGTPGLLGMESMWRHESLRPGQAQHFIEVKCAGDELNLKVDGELLISVRDSSFTTGAVGVSAGTFREGGTDILFDRFQVLYP
jgi:hypothetical protein